MQSSESDIRSALDEIAKAFAIESPTTFTLAGRAFTIPGDPNHEETHKRLIALLKEQLYQQCYCRRFTGIIEDVPMARQDDNFSRELSMANLGRSRWSEGWAVAAVEANGKIVAHLNGAMRTFWPGEYLVPDLPATSPRVGAAVRMHVVTESFSMQPGYYFSFGESLEDRRDGVDVVRFYWAVEATEAPTLIRALTERFNRFAVPFRFKCPTHPARFARLDAAVLYVNCKFYQIAAELASELYGRVRQGMRSMSPLFTKQLAPGLGFAEDPGNAESFGMHRCGITAEGLWEAHTRNVSGESRLASMEECFARHGLSLDHPYLNPGSIDQYEFPEPPGI